MQAVIENASIGLPLKFDRVLVIVGAGAVDERLLRSLVDNGAAVIAADGGADACARAGIMPEAIVGDMDSLENLDDWAKNTRIVKFEEQSTTDFEKCLYATEAALTIALGMTGKRFDHTLAALDSVARHAHKRHILLVDEKDLALGVCGKFSFAVDPGDRVSVHPLGRVKFKVSEGLLYPLDGITLAPGERTGTSNTATEGAFSIVPEDGENAGWLLIVDRKYLSALTAQVLESK